MADPLPDHYKSLGLSSTATKDQIRTAYKKLVLSSHPDKCQDEKEKKRREPIFHAVQAAYECLYDDDLRKTYDHDLLIEASRKEYRPPPPTQRAGPKTRSQSYCSAPPRPPTPDYYHTGPRSSTFQPQSSTTFWAFDSRTGGIFEYKTASPRVVPRGAKYNPTRHSYDFVPSSDEDDFLEHEPRASRKATVKIEKEKRPMMTRPARSKKTPPPESIKDQEKREKRERKAHQEAEQAQRDRIRRAEQEIRTADKNATAFRSQSPSPMREESKREEPKVRRKVKRSTTTPNVSSSTDEARRSRAVPDDSKKKSSSSSKSKYDEQERKAKEYVDARYYTASPDPLQFTRSYSEKYERSPSRPRYARGYTEDIPIPRFGTSRSSPADIRIPSSNFRDERTQSATKIYSVGADGLVTELDSRDRGINSATLPLRPKTAKTPSSSGSFMGFKTERRRAAAPGPIPLPRRMSSGIGADYVLTPGGGPSTPGGTRYFQPYSRDDIRFVNTPGYTAYASPAMSPGSPYNNPYTTIPRSGRSGVVR